MRPFRVVTLAEDHAVQFVRIHILFYAHLCVLYGLGRWSQGRDALARHLLDLILRGGTTR